MCCSCWWRGLPTSYDAHNNIRAGGGRHDVGRAARVRGSGSKRLCCIPIFSEKWSLNFGVRKARGKQGLSKPLAKSFLMANAS